LEDGAESSSEGGGSDVGEIGQKKLRQAKIPNMERHYSLFCSQTQFFLAESARKITVRGRRNSSRRSLLRVARIAIPIKDRKV
jgi:hypothetical protein